MVERKVCTFCGNEIEPGTGKMFIKKDGTIYNFCSMKCQKNLLVLKRIPRRVRWTKNFKR
jgi:large subunit ribosomal protein L24e